MEMVGGVKEGVVIKTKADIEQERKTANIDIYTD